MGIYIIPTFGCLGKRIYPFPDYKYRAFLKETTIKLKMKFLVLIALLALVAGIFMEEYKKPEEKKHIKKYFHKKWCFCIKEKKGVCKKLKCCEIYKHVPYKVIVKYCKFGKCEFIHKEKHVEKEAGVKKP